MPYTSMNGNMFAFLSKEGVLAFRLSKSSREAFLVEHPEATVHQHGRLMKDYVDVTGVQDLGSVWKDAVANAQTLKPKKTKR